jgi:hypothetical protein
VRSVGERTPRAGILGAAARSSSIRVSEPSAVANRTNGRIFGLDPVQGPYSCSGTSLATPSGSIVLTAGHCVYEDGQWGRDLVFVPGFDHERRPFGTFVASAIYTTSQWQASENSDFDVAALRVGPGVAGTLSQTVGARGWTSGSSRYLPMQIFGYPAGALDGMELRACAAEGLGSDPRSYGEAGPPPLPAHCDMADGSSGGAWMAGELIDGVTSYGYPAQPDRLYSPYFGASIGKFLSSLP